MVVMAYYLYLWAIAMYSQRNSRLKADGSYGLILRAVAPKALCLKGVYRYGIHAG